MASTLWGVPLWRSLCSPCQAAQDEHGLLANPFPGHAPKPPACKMRQIPAPFREPTAKTQDAVPLIHWHRRFLHLSGEQSSGPPYLIQRRPECRICLSRIDTTSANVSLLFWAHWAKRPRSRAASFLAIMPRMWQNRTLAKCERRANWTTPGSLLRDPMRT